LKAVAPFTKIGHTVAMAVLKPHIFLQQLKTPFGKANSHFPSTLTTDDSICYRAMCMFV